jgi:hypothetical protein
MKDSTMIKFKIIKINLVLIIFSIGLLKNAESQSKWFKTYGGPASTDVSYAISTYGRNGYLLAGYTTIEPYHDSRLGYIIQVDSLGDSLWSRKYETEWGNYITSVQRTKDNNYIFAGSIFLYKTRPTGTQYFDSDIYILKTNTNGDTLWTRYFGGASDDVAGHVICLEDGYLISGSTTSYGPGLGNENIWLIRTDQNGDSLWTRIFGTTKIDWPTRLIQTSDGGFIITGYSQPNLVIIKTDSSGNEQWQKKYNGNGYYSVGGDIIELDNDGYIIVGQTQTLSGYTDLWFLKADSEGDTLWSVTHGGSNHDYGGIIVPTVDNNYLILGNTRSFSTGDWDMWLLKLDSIGDTVWTKTYGSNDNEKAEDIVKASDDGFIITGTITDDNQVDKDIFILRVNSEGDTVYTTNIDRQGNIKRSKNYVRNYPNPFNSSTVIKFNLPKKEYVSIVLFDNLGKKVKTILSQILYPGAHQVKLTSDNLSSGIYYYIINARSFKEVKKVILIK